MHQNRETEKTNQPGTKQLDDITVAGMPLELYKTLTFVMGLWMILVGIAFNGLLIYIYDNFSELTNLELFLTTMLLGGIVVILAGRGFCKLAQKEQTKEIIEE